MCHGGNQYINLIKDAFDVRNNVKYHHVSYIISYRIAFSNSTFHILMKILYIQDS